MDYTKEMYEELMREIGFKQCCINAAWDMPYRLVFQAAALSVSNKEVVDRALRRHMGSVLESITKVNQQHVGECLNANPSRMSDFRLRRNPPDTLH